MNECRLIHLRTNKPAAQQIINVHYDDGERVDWRGRDRRRYAFSTSNRTASLLASSSTSQTSSARRQCRWARWTLCFCQNPNPYAGTDLDQTKLIGFHYLWISFVYFVIKYFEQAAISCILPKEWKDVHYGGLGRLVMFIDLDCRFDVLRFSQMLKHRIMEANGNCRPRLINYDAVLFY